MEPKETTTPEIITRKDYDFNGLNYFQEELTLKETNLLVALFSDNDQDKFKNLGFDLGKYFLEKNLLFKFFSIILKIELGRGYIKNITEPQLDALKPSQLLEVINDFFTLNTVLSTVLVSIRNALDSMKTTPMSSPTSKKETKKTQT
jgi:hypothetical protein